MDDIAQELLEIAEELQSSKKDASRQRTAGYTHYWSVKREFTNDEWSEITKGAKKIIKKAESDDIELAGPMGSGDPDVGSNAIALNGSEEKGEDHESFILDNAEGTEFCKTAEKPYDAVVVSILALAKEVAPDAIEMDSDGGNVFSNPPYSA